MTDAVGFIGLGIMGRSMARHLLGAGSRSQSTPRSPGPVEELAAAGARACASSAEVARVRIMAITMLPDTPDVELVLLGEARRASDLGRS